MKILILILKTIADDPTFVVIDDLTDEDAPRVNYLDLGADGAIDTNCRSRRISKSFRCCMHINRDSYQNLAKL